jgi:peptide-methionine (S)-S-oxide reductase
MSLPVETTMQSYVIPSLAFEEFPKKLGDVVSVELTLRDPETKQVVDTPFDQGNVSFVLNSNVYFPGIHQIAAKLLYHQPVKEKVSGPRKKQELIASVPLEYCPPGLNVGNIVQLQNGLKARVTAVSAQAVTIDANPPLAGKDFIVEMKLHERKTLSSFSRATFAAGCFWGLELAYQRKKGVVYTSVGYTHGSKVNPTYDEVCSGTTNHAEAVTVIYDPRVVTYKELLDVFWKRHDPTQLNRQGNDVGTQYRSGVYCHTNEQLAEAQVSMGIEQNKYKEPIVTEIKQNARFWFAEEFHQQYLEKGGQSAKKDANEKIRCYG